MCVYTCQHDASSFFQACAAFAIAAIELLLSTHLFVYPFHKILHCKRLLDKTYRRIRVGEQFPQRLVIYFVRSHEAYPGIAVYLLQLLVQLKAIYLGHPDVKKYQIVHACLEAGKRLRRIIECRNLEAVVF